MTELYGNISNTIRELASNAWTIAVSKKDPMEAAEFLNNVTNYYSNILSQEEVEFLQFYFRLQMEMRKE